MKKIILFFVTFFSLVNFVNAASLFTEDIPYYVKIHKPGENDIILNVKKIYNQKNEVVFNVDFEHYDVGENFTVLTEYNKKTWLISELPFLNTAIYFGYNQDPNDLHYFLTQVFIWNNITNYKAVITDAMGNEITTYQKEYNKIFNDIYNYLTISSIFLTNHTTEIWTTNKFEYNYGVPVLDNPLVEGLNIYNENRNIIIENEKVGKYTLDFTKDMDQENYCYTDGTNVYIQNLKGPKDLKFTMNYTVKGTKLVIEENLQGVKNRFGDAKINNKYEIYLDDELKLITNEKENYVKSNSSYLLKDASLNIGFKDINDVYFKVQEEETKINLEREVISKNVLVHLNDLQKYYFYLKSNNELYEVVESENNNITLPYGIYYIKTEDNLFYQEFVVADDIDEILEINTPDTNEVLEENEQQKLDKDQNSIEELAENTETESFLETASGETEEDYSEETEIVNPQTHDNIYSHFMHFFISGIFLLILKLRNKKFLY